MRIALVALLLIAIIPFTSAGNVRDGLIDSWNFEPGYTNSSGAIGAATGILFPSTGTITYTEGAGIIGYGANMSGAGTSFTMPSPITNISDGGMTMMGHFYPVGSTPANTRYLAQGNSISTGTGLYMWGWTTHEMRSYRLNTASPGGIILTPDTQYYDMVLRAATGNTRVYTDGTERTAMRIIIGTPPTPQNELVGGGGYIGYIDEVSIWDKSIDVSDIAIINNGGTPLTYPFNIITDTSEWYDANFRLDINYSVSNATALDEHLSGIFYQSIPITLSKSALGITAEWSVEGTVSFEGTCDYNNWFPLTESVVANCSGDQLGFRANLTQGNVTDMELTAVLPASNTAPTHNATVLFDDEGNIENPVNVLGEYGDLLTLNILADDVDGDNLTVDVVIDRPDTTNALTETINLSGATNTSSFVANAYGTWVYAMNISDGIDSVLVVGNFTVTNTHPLITSLTITKLGGGTCYAGYICVLHIVVDDDECSLSNLDEQAVVVSPNNVTVLTDNSFTLTSNSSLDTCLYDSDSFTTFNSGGYSVFVSLTDNMNSSSNKTESIFLPQIAGGGGGGGSAASVIVDGDSCPVEIVSRELVYRQDDLVDYLEITNLVGREQRVDLELTWVVGETAMPGTITPTRLTLAPGARDTYMVSYVPLDGEQFIETQMRLLVGGSDCVPVEVPVYFRGSGDNPLFSLTSTSGDSSDLTVPLIAGGLLLMLFALLIFFL